MIELQNLSCAYDEKIIFKDINITIPSHLAILGANGSGKSTLARCLTNISEYQGTIYIDGKNTKDIDLKELAKLISYIPTKLEIYDEFISVFDFVLLSRYPYKEGFFDYTQEDKAKVHDALHRLNILPLQNHSVHSLSSGEQQLTLIASALVAQSQIIIFDEPTANLDPKNSKIIASHIKELQKSYTIILITHDLQLASFIQSPVLFIKEAQATFYEKDFFQLSNLEELYEVSFESLAVKYG